MSKQELYKESVIESAICKVYMSASASNDIESQVYCPAGIIDILTDDSIIEVKRQLDRSSMIRAIGQLSIYGLFYPEHEKQVLGLWHEDVELFERLCEPLDIKIISLHEWEITTYLQQL